MAVRRTRNASAPVRFGYPAPSWSQKADIHGWTTCHAEVEKVDLGRALPKAGFTPEKVPVKTSEASKLQHATPISVG